MRRKQNFLLAGVAALALVAGTGLSLAQTQPSSGTQTGTQSMAPKHGAGASPSTTNGAMTQHHVGNAGAAAQQNGNLSAQQNAGQGGNRSAQSAQNKPNKMGEKHMNHAAQNKENRSGAANTAMQEHGRTRVNVNTAERGRHHERTRFGTAEEHRRGERTRFNTAEQRNGNLRGLQANTSIPMEQRGNMWGQHRTEIDRVVDASDAPRADRVDFNVRVGSVVPRRSVRFVPVPETLVQIEPRWQGYYYFVYENQVVVVSPRTMRIVAVLPA
jgi:Protein of unknown function (DUF1236)